ncbi:MAG: lamin tail domain-containing protein [Brumimicrobium sp.]|nr:lamin tail domain-containing protein [Brumimicrobium sp.]
MALPLCLFSQVSDNFDDGDFTSNPLWTGTAADFIVNANNRLQLNASVAGASYLSTAHNLTQLTDREWRYNIRYNFSPSGSNGGDTYLTATNADLSLAPDGIFIRIGETGSLDPIRLFERSGGIETQILESAPGIVATSFDISVKIIHRPNNDWELYYDLAGGSAYQLDATVNYPTAIMGSHLGFSVQYTSSNITNFYFDNVYAGPVQVDVTPPSLVSVNPVSANQLEVLFDEGIDQASGENTANYSVNNGLGSPSSVSRSATNLALFTLTFASNFTVGQLYEITTQNVEDFSGNPSLSETATFQYVEAQTPVYGDIIINEFMADETPSVGLPEVQYVELFNRSNKYFNLNGWKLSDNSSSGTVQNIWLYPGEYVLLVPTSGLTFYPSAINVTSWASLNNSGDDIRLETDSGILVDELSYTIDWYKNTSKDDGGWSLERINPDLPCSDGSNWRASEDPAGGTPNALNSVVEYDPDITAAFLTDVIAQSPNFLTINFNEGLDSLSVVNAAFSSTPSLTITQRYVSSTFPKTVTFEFSQNLVAGEVYSFSLAGFEDCSGNPNSFTGTFVLPEIPVGDEIIINEILFNPLTGGSDFVELYNRSDKYINLQNWELANFSNDTIANNKIIGQYYILEPNDYVVITKDSNFQKVNYPFAIPGKFIQMASLPSYNTDSSTAYLIYFGDIMDKVSYSEDWHFKLLQDDKGVSLERFDPSGPSDDLNNWHSASETVGFATPGRVNSQFNVANTGATINLSSSSFSPDSDGFEDVLLISYELTEPSLVGDLIIYDDMGRKIRTLLKSHLLGLQGIIKWDGLDDDGNKASIGPYILIFEALNADSGEKIAIRKVVTLAGKL